MALKRATYAWTVVRVERHYGVGWRGGLALQANAVQPLGVSLGVAAAGADLGGSSKYSSATLEGRSGERFPVKRSATGVSRS